MRWALGAVGVVMGLWGAVLVLPLVDVDLALWFVAGPVVHDLLLAPLFGGVGLLIARWVPTPWRAAVQVGGTFTGVLVLLAVPLLWRPFAGGPNPGLLDRDYGVGLLVAVAVVWSAVLVVTLVEHRALKHKRPHADR